MGCAVGQNNEEGLRKILKAGNSRASKMLKYPEGRNGIIVIDMSDLGPTRPRAWHQI